MNATPGLYPGLDTDAVSFLAISDWLLKLILRFLNLIGQRIFAVKIHLWKQLFSGH